MPLLFKFYGAFLGSGSHFAMVTTSAARLSCLASMIVGQNWRYSPPMTHDHGRASKEGALLTGMSSRRCITVTLFGSEPISRPMSVRHGATGAEGAPPAGTVVDYAINAA